ncbi:MAG: S8 family serine peptidase [Planctomycetes bacterium]|nr:S8 family serine peptidase [Planctomycetota bacterium]
MKPEKLAPGLLGAFEDFQREGVTGLARHARAMGLVAAENVPKPPRAIVFVHCDHGARLDHLASLDVRVNQPQGGLRTAYLSLSSLSALSDEPGVHRILPSRYLRLSMDVAPGAVHLPAFRTRTGMTGRGVVVGVVDSGIDTAHPAFAGRILRVWDQVLPGAGVPEGGYGMELTGAALASSTDTHGHGTHVAGIAAGVHATYGGVAPGADIIMVKSDLQDAHIADGVRYIFRVAGELHRPAVVNLSLGAHWDAHDGTDSLSQIIDAESGPGKIVCCAAGNEGNDNLHARATVPAGGTRTPRFRVPAGGAVRWAVLNGWYSGQDRMEVSIQSPGGFATPYQAVSPGAAPAVAHALPDAQVRITTPGPDPINGDHQFLVELQPRNQLAPSVTAGVWRLRLRGAHLAAGGVVDVWALDSTGDSAVQFTGSSVSDSLKIGSPGTSRSAVTVASYTTKVSWTDAGGTPRHLGLLLNDISDFSSEGPLRGGRRKPDATAPGAMIAAPLSSASAVRPEMVVAAGYRLMAGTSMATPFVSGLVALFLERNPHLDPAGVKALLAANCRIPGRPAGTFDPKWGLGLIDATAL